MYTFIKLTLPPPSMIVFDASNRDQCEVKRSRTNTPLQAFIMMNDPTVLEASRVFAQQLLAKNMPLEEKVAAAFRNILCRKASDQELGILMNYHKEQLQLFTGKKLDALKTLSVGDSPVNQRLNLDESAALMKVINTIYNLEEAITKT